MTGFSRRGACPALSAPMQTGDGLLVRLNSVAGGISPNALIDLCESAVRHGNGIMEVTARGSLQIRGLTIESALILAAEVDALGIAVRTGVPVETGPLAGLDPDEVADPRPLAERIREGIEAAGLGSRLGPKVSVVIDGGGWLGMGTVLADVRLVAERHESGILWRLSVAGDGRTASQLALLPETAAADAALAILAAIAALGREGRARDLEPEQLAVLTQGRNGSRPALPPSIPIGTFPLAENLHALAIALPFGSVPAETLIALVQAAASLGAFEIRFAPERTLLVLGPVQPACAELRSTAASLGFVTDPADPRTKIAACPGTPACGSGHIETRKIAEEIAKEDGDTFDRSLSLHVSGCAKGCAHPAEAALTLVGGEKGAGLVVSGTAKGLPAAYTPGYDAVRGFGRVAELLRNQRRPEENSASCLARLGETRVAAAFRQG
ncbi:precorrin-3B synthase [Mesorhizobium sp. WSM2239]|uniref:Precorrin-3B synthase n=2 Tax=unclassified Mesorhizobium TaxID=325217 RepID=A0AAU8D4H6_9HYPH